MMTILHVDTNGHKRYIEVDSVNRTPEGTIVFRSNEKITSGQVFIMNSEGKTVGKVDFDKEQKHG